MSDPNPREHAEAHGAHGHDLKPEYKSEAVKTEASTTPAGEHEGSSHNSRDEENHGHAHGKPGPLAKTRGPPISQSSKGGQGLQQPKPPTSGKKSKSPEHPTEDDSDSENDESSDSANDSHGGNEHMAGMMKRGKLRGKPAPSTTKGGGGGPSGPPKGPKR